MKETALDRIYEALRNSREKSLDWCSMIEYMTFVVESELSDFTTGAYLPVLKQICKSKDAKSYLQGFHPVNVAVGMYIEYGKPKGLSIIKVIRLYKRDRKTILNVRQRIRKSHRIARKPR